MLVRFIVTLIIVYLLYRLAKGILRLSGSKTGTHPEKPIPIKGEDLVEDPYCHVNVPVSQAYKAAIDGKTVYFCSRECYEIYIKK
jgi:YHS domain-containing protein